MKTIQRLWIGSTVLFCCVFAASAAGKAADPNTYLSVIVKEMQKQWPDNRTINIVFHGHSVPAGYFKTPQIDTLNAYPHLLLEGLKQQFPYAAINIIVTAIGGENSEAGQARFEKDVLAHRPDVIFIDYALNDRTLGLAPAEKAWQSMIQQAKTAAIPVILMTPTADMNADMNDPQDPLNQHAQQIHRLADENSVGLVDSLTAFKQYVKKGGKLENVMSQPNHPNRKGHDRVVKSLLLWFHNPK